MKVWHYYEPVGWEECRSAAPYAPHDALPHVVTFYEKPTHRPTEEDTAASSGVLKVIRI